MKKWYRSVPVKGVLAGLTIVSAVVVSLSTVLILGSQGEGIVKSDNMLGFQTGRYEESSAFEARMKDVSYNVMEGIAAKQSLEAADGTIDQDRLVDIMEYFENGKISGDNESGISYTLGKLAEWGQKDFEYTDIVVCKKPDGTYHYYYLDEFKELLNQGVLKINVPFEEEEPTHGSEELIGNVIDFLKEGYSPMDYYGERMQVLDEEDVMLYGDFWPFQQGLDEKEKPVGAASILEIVNETPELNGKLETVFRALEDTILGINRVLDLYEASKEMWIEGNTNFRYLLIDKDNKRVYTNNSAYREFKNAEDSVEKMKALGKYVVVKPKMIDFETNTNTDVADWNHMTEICGLDGDYVFAAAVDTGYPIQDMFYAGAEEYAKYAPYLRRAGVFIILGGFFLITSLIWLTVAAGRRPEDEELHLNAYDRWKTGLGAAAAIVPWGFMTGVLGTRWNGVGYSASSYGESLAHASYVDYTFSMNAADVLVISAYVGMTMLLFLLGYLSLVRRIKGKTIWKNSILCWLYKGLRVFWSHRSVCLRAVLLIGGFILVHWVAWLGSSYGFFVLLMFASEAVAVYFAIRASIEKSQIRKGIQEIASGNVGYQIPLEKMHGESREMAELVNGIGDGLNNAVSAAMKSERLKTDLITNVSHDIKTPLTSIINYVDLLKRENLDNPKIQGYLEILEAKAQRLKTLTEDVVEASKVSSGNITLEMMDVNLVEMVNQTIGEFSEKMEAKNLTVVASLPEEPAIVHVDGRRMWRVLENIFNNAAKYAMPGTRVYADLRVKEGKVEFSLKNVSEHSLNINAEELTERFIRGDVSRSTEGSGLGLSIARDLTEMQGGKFKLYVDGDLFKVMIEF